MDLKTFTTNFGLLADTLKGIPKLREMILQLAVMGKLVTQNPKDEPASVLLEKIAAEKEKLIEEEKIKKSKPLPPNDPNELPYELPEGWNWSRLVELGTINPRNEADDTTDAAFIPMPLISDKYGVLPNFEVRPWKDIRKGFTHFAEGDVALAKITPCFQNGKSAVFERLPNGIGAGTTELHVFRPLGNTLIPKYVWLYLKSPRFLSEGETKMTGTAGQKRVPKMYFEGNPFPLPPLTEQKRIVSKVDELMALCDELEERQKKRDEVRVSVNAACLHEMTSSELKISKKGWIRTRNHFDLLYETPDNVAALRQAILQLAVMGKLVPQNPKDEPASVLLEKIAAEKEILIEEGKIKRSKRLQPIETNEILYDLPKGWEWVRLGNLQEFINGYAFPSADYVDDGIGIIRIGDLQNGQVSTVEMKRVPSSYLDTLDEKFQVKLDNLLIAMSGATTGKLAFNRTSETFLLNQRVGKFNLFFIENNYACFFLSTRIQENLRISAGSAIPNLSTIQINNMCFPLPPLAEQKRIVKKVDELMALINEMESKMQESQSTAEKLMEAVVKQLTSV